MMQMSPSLFADERLKLTSSEGKSIEAEVIAIDHQTDTVRFRRVSDDRVFTTKIEIFNPLTQLKLRLKKIITPNPPPLLAETVRAEKNPGDEDRPGFSENGIKVP